MTQDNVRQSLHEGDHVVLINDDWAGAGCDFVLVEAEPVPGSTQCIIEGDGQTIVVSRNDLRPAVK